MKPPQDVRLYASRSHSWSTQDNPTKRYDDLYPLSIDWSRVVGVSRGDYLAHRFRENPTLPYTFPPRVNGSEMHFVALALDSGAELLAWSDRDEWWVGHLAGIS